MKNERVQSLLEGLEEPSAIPEVTAEDRLILNNIFDTQPAKRAAYLKQKGFEIDPKDDNRFRPIGSKGAYVGKIDPGYSEAFEKGGVTNLLKELSLDAGDIAFDTGLGALIRGLAVTEGAAAGGATGAAAGSVVPGAGTGIGAGVGAIIGGLSAGFLSGAASNAATETLKAGLGELLLDENIPHDYKATAMQSFLAGAAPAVVSGVGKTANRLVGKARVNAVLDGLKNAAQKFGPNLTPEIIDDAAKRPETFAPKNLEKIGQKMNSTYASIFGMDPEKAAVAKRVQQVKPDSAIGKALQPLNKAADDEMAMLTKNPEANFKLRDVLDSFQTVKSKFENSGIVTDAEAAALKQIDNYENQVLKMAERNLRASGVEGEISRAKLLNADLDFGQVRTIGKKLKDAAMDDKVQGAEYLAQIAGSGEGQLGTKLTQKANALGSNWQEIQSQRHGLLDLHNRASEGLKPANLEVAFLGDQTGTGKARIQSLLSEMDEKAGTSLSQNIKDQNAQRAFKQFYDNPDVYEQGNPLVQRIVAVGSTLKGGNIPGAIMEGFSPTNKIARGQNLAELFQKNLEKAGQYDRAFKDKFQNPLSAALSGAGGAALSKAGVEDLPEQTPVGEVSFNQDRVNSLLEGL